MKLIEAFIIAQQEYGIYGDWKAIHADGYYIGRHLIERGPKFRTFAVYSAHDSEGIVSQNDRLETVLSDFAEQYPYQTLDERWKVSRWE